MPSVNDTAAAEAAVADLVDRLAELPVAALLDLRRRVDEELARPRLGPADVIVVTKAAPA